MKIELLQGFVPTAKSMKIGSTFIHDPFVCELVVHWLKKVFNIHQFHELKGFQP
jgi:hypothetical protein